MDAQKLKVPLWGAVLVGGTVLSSVVLMVLWAFSAFASREDFVEQKNRVTGIEQDVKQIMNDVSYIRATIDKDHNR